MHNDTVITDAAIEPALDIDAQPASINDQATLAKELVWVNQQVEEMERHIQIDWTQPSAAFGRMSHDDQYRYVERLRQYRTLRTELARQLAVPGRRDQQKNKRATQSLQTLTQTLSQSVLDPLSQPRLERLLEEMSDAVQCLRDVAETRQWEVQRCLQAIEHGFYVEKPVRSAYDLRDVLESARGTSPEPEPEAVS